MLSTNWPGTSAGIKWVLPILFLVSLITWAMGIALTVKAANHELANGRRERISNVVMYFYTSALPMATTLAAAIDYVLYTRRLLFPVASIIWGLIAYGAWAFVLTIWSTCEYSPDTGSSGLCPTFWVYDSYPSSLYQSGLWYGRLTTGAMGNVLALTQMALGARAVDLTNKEKRRARRMERDDKRSLELENVA